MSSPPPARCTFYIVLRQRTCKFEVRAGSAEPFCEYHSTVDADGVRRVPCPVDPSHTVRENQLSKHVPRCPHAKVLKRVHEAAAVCTVKDVNRGGSDDEQHGIDEHMATLKGRELAALLTTTEWASLVATIEAAAATTADVASQWWNGPAEPPCPPECLPWVNPEGGLLQQQRTEDGEGGKLFFSQYKHNAQQAAIAYHMRRVGLLPDVRGRCYVEAGAGKGYLTLLVSEVYKAEQFVLLDQGKGGRNKADKGLKGHKRLVVDLADVVLEKVLDEKELQQTKLVVIGKHLCGAATDMALRAYQRALTHCVGTLSCSRIKLLKALQVWPSRRAVDIGARGRRLSGKRTFASSDWASASSS